MQRPSTAGGARRPLNHSTEVYGDLHIFTSSTYKEPTKLNCTQEFSNPFSYVIINNKDPNETIDAAPSKKKKGNEEDRFECEKLYISFYSSKGCTVNVSTSFPQEKEKVIIKSTGGQTAKTFKEEYMKEIKEKVDELAGDIFAQQQYQKKIKDIQLNLIREKRGNWDCDIDFVKQNVDETDFWETQKGMREVATQIQEQRTVEAKQKRDQILKEKIEKVEFGMIKWDLYRMKCEEIEEQYADFKRYQRKIKDLVSLVTLSSVLLRLRDNYVQNHAIVADRFKRTYITRKWQTNYRKHLLKRGQNEIIRNTNTIRNALTFKIPPLQNQYITQSKDNVREFMNETTEQFSMIKKHLDWVQK